MKVIWMSLRELNSTTRTPSSCNITIRTWCKITLIMLINPITSPFINGSTFDCKTSDIELYNLHPLHFHINLLIDRLYVYFHDISMEYILNNNLESLCHNHYILSLHYNPSRLNYPHRNHIVHHYPIMIWMMFNSNLWWIHLTRSHYPVYNCGMLWCSWWIYCGRY